MPVVLKSSCHQGHDEERQITPEEQLEDDDDALFVASEKKAEEKANKEDGTWEAKKTQRHL